MGKLWQKDYELDELLETFTVGIDWQSDRELVRADCAGSIAHAMGLQKAGILSKEDVGVLTAELRTIARDAEAGSFAIRKEDEDCHTAIENRLVERVGDAGKRIHTGRSRNDQVLTATRLLARERLLSIRASLLELIATTLDFASRHEMVPMPGRTHMQLAMPSSVGLWAASLAEQLMDDYALLSQAAALADRSPLGSAASYGVPLPVDRNHTASLMGFAGPWHTVLGANNSRGKVEAVILDALEHTALSISKYAQDLILFSLPEFGYFALPRELCSGSSIMPQKKNPDGLELIRSRTAMLGGWAIQAKSIIRSLPSGYNRDFQDTKEPFLRGLSTGLGVVRIMELTFARLEVRPEALRKAFAPEIYATDEALRLVAGGMPFRDAYRQVGTHLEDLAGFDPDQVVAGRTGPGNTGNLGLADLAGRLGGLAASLEGERARFRKAMKDLLDTDEPL